MNEKEAWLFAATQFDLLSIGEPTVLNESGLCRIIFYLHHTDKISKMISDSMFEKINIYRNEKILGDFFWPTCGFHGTVEYATCRADLAREFAKLFN